MLKLLYKPVAIVAGIVGGLLSGLIFKRIWKIVGRGSDVPAPMDSERSWREILLAAGLHGVIYALVKTAVDRGAAEWTRKKTGIWPAGTATWQVARPPTGWSRRPHGQVTATRWQS